MNTITIRLANQTDAATLADFQIRMAKETENLALDPPTVTAGVKAVFDAPQLGQYWIAQSRDEVVGCTMITYEWSDWRNGMIWWIQSVYVRPEFRKSGVFRAIYTHLRELVLNDPHVRGLRLYVDKTNIPAERTYKALGMNGDHYTTFEWMKQDDA